jgi:catechol 2,3-dioxygenase-like lactoylglutathione lyase family enzyme
MGAAREEPAAGREAWRRSTTDPTVRILVNLSCDRDRHGGMATAPVNVITFEKMLEPPTAIEDDEGSHDSASNTEPSPRARRAMIRDVLHFGFTVRDIEASVAWYTDVLGLELVHRQRSENAYIRELVGVEGAILEVAQFRLPGLEPLFSTHVLELIQYVRGSTATPADPAPNRVAAAHLAFIVDDIHERVGILVSAGAELVNPPVEVTEGVNAGGYACYIRDPDGNMLEFMQFGPERAARLGLERKARR